jgi:hypothetical protein
MVQDVFCYQSATLCDIKLACHEPLFKINTILQFYIYTITELSIQELTELTILYKSYSISLIDNSRARFPYARNRS